MKIISGKYRNIKLETIKEKSTRPTLDRAKQGIFNAIQFQIIDKTVIDFFAGSGALAIEAISRGAKFAYFVEINKNVVKCIENNLAKLKNFSNYEILNLDYKQAFSFFISKKMKKIFDIIFLDPPYVLTNDIKIILDLLFQNNLINDNGLIVIETNIKFNLKILNNYLFKEIKTYKYGNVLMVLCRL